MHLYAFAVFLQNVVIFTITYSNYCFNVCVCLAPTCVREIYEVT